MPRWKRLLKGLTVRPVLIECRRWLSVVFMPWFGILAICLLASWYCLYVIGVDALLAPVLKVWAFAKPTLLVLLKAGAAVLIFVWFNVFGKLAGWLGELFTMLLAYMAGLKAWSAKKMLRQFARFGLSFITRFFLISMFLNLLFGDERKGVKRVPKLLLTRLKNSFLGRLYSLWQHATDRQKRLVFGALLCLILIIAGHAILGFSILLFDLLWEIAIILARLFARLWKFLWPIISRMIPNFIGNFVTRKLLPIFADIIPVIRDDHRVMYLRFNLRQRFRDVKASLYRRSRARRREVRYQIRPFVSEKLRQSKSSLLSATKELDEDKKEPDS